MSSPIPYGRQYITEEDIRAVTEVLTSDYLTQGPVIGQFEAAFADYTGAKYAVAVANGTAALHLCTLAMGIEPGDCVITTPLTFAASANCVRYCGGEVLFADINPNTWLLDIENVRKCLESSPGKKIRGIIPVDFAGRSVDMEAFRELADEYDLWIIEDACHAPGGFFRDSKGDQQYCGNGRFADVSIFSFHPVKHIAAGEGGMITTNDEELYNRLLKLRTHGITKDAEEFENSIHFAVGREPSAPISRDRWPGWYMEMQELGYNYRLTDFQAALGLSQLGRADQGLERRREIAGKYAEAFAGKPYIRRQAGAVEGHAYHLYIVEAEDRFGLYNFLREKDIYTQIHYIPLHLMPYYRKQGWTEGDMPAAEAYYSGCISLPMYPALSDKEQKYVIDAVQEFYEG